MDQQEKLPPDTPRFTNVPVVLTTNAPAASEIFFALVDKAQGYWHEYELENEDFDRKEWLKGRFEAMTRLAKEVRRQTRYAGGL